MRVHASALGDVVVHHVDETRVWRPLVVRGKQHLWKNPVLFVYQGCLKNIKIRFLERVKSSCLEGVKFVGRNPFYKVLRFSEIIFEPGLLSISLSLSFSLSLSLSECSLSECSLSLSRSRWCKARSRCLEGPLLSPLQRAHMSCERERQQVTRC